MRMLTLQLGILLNPYLVWPPTVLGTRSPARCGIAAGRQPRQLHW